MASRTFLTKNAKLLKPLGIILTIVIILALGWQFGMPHYRPGLEEGEVYGIDVSNHQKSLNWSKVAQDDIAFAYIKATEGSSAQDKSFQRHWQGAKRAGLHTGAYHYFSLCSSGKTQAENFLRTIPGDSRMLPAALDLEFSPFCDNHPSRREVLKHIDQVLELVGSGTDKQVLLYVGDDFDRTYRIKDHYRDLKYWQLRYLLRPTDKRDYIWQVGGFFYVDGAPGKVDLNIGRIDDL